MRGRPAKPTSERLRQLEEILRSHGLPLTLQRRLVLETVMARRDHPTAEKVFVELQAAHPEVARATVYRTLEKLVKLGVLRRVCHPGSSVRYDPDTERHHHLVCVECSRMVDFHDPRLNGIPLPDARAHGFHVSDYTIQFRGLCESCDARRKRRVAERKTRR